MSTSRRAKVVSSRCELMGNPDLKRKVDAAAYTIRQEFPSGLARPALRALNAAGFTELAQLAKVREEEVAALHGMGPNALRILREALQSRRLSFRR